MWVGLGLALGLNQVYPSVEHELARRGLETAGSVIWTEEMSYDCKNELERLVQELLNY